MISSLLAAERFDSQVRSRNRLWQYSGSDTEKGIPFSGKLETNPSSLEKRIQSFLYGAPQAL